MSELDEAGRALIALASDAHDPTDADRTRVRAALAGRLGTAAGLGVGATVGLAATAKAAAGATGAGATGGVTAAATGSALAGSALATKLVVAVALTATVGVGATVKLTRHAAHAPARSRVALATTEVRRPRTLATAPRDIPTPEPEPPAASPPGAGPVSAPSNDRPRLAPFAPAAPEPELGATAVPQTAPPSEPPSPETAPRPSSTPGPGTAPRLPPAELRADAPPGRSPRAAPASVPACMPNSGEDPGPRRSEFTVADEARLVRDGVRALREGQAACALSLLDAHARYYPEGVLAEEREAERALALADLGRIAEARAAATAFLRKHHGSPLGARLRQRIPGLER